MRLFRAISARSPHVPRSLSTGFCTAQSTVIPQNIRRFSSRFTQLFHQRLRYAFRGRFPQPHQIGQSPAAFCDAHYARARSVEDAGRRQFGERDRLRSEPQRENGRSAQVQLDAQAGHPQQGAAGAVRDSEKDHQDSEFGIKRLFPHFSIWLYSTPRFRPPSGGLFFWAELVPSAERTLKV